MKKIIMVLGKSGSGKDYLVERVLIHDRLSGEWVGLKKYSTRPPRKEETKNFNMFIEFISDKEYNELLNQGKFLVTSSFETEQGIWRYALEFPESDYSICIGDLEMYEKFCEKNKFKYEVIYLQKGEEAGIKSVNIKISSENAYGLLKYESGVHRLVRISPFDSNSRRHTSFASVNVTPEIKKNIDIEINESDLKIDVYHSSGAGGQSVNTSNSAVRITHLPSKIVVAVQNERSQLRNKEIAMEILKNKLYLLELEKNETLTNKLKNNDSINFGSQIRSYILEPYKLVKDYRTNFESNDPDSILNGEIMDMLIYNVKEMK